MNVVNWRSTVPAGPENVFWQSDRTRNQMTCESEKRPLKSGSNVTDCLRATPEDASFGKLPSQFTNHDVESMVHRARPSFLSPF